MDDNTIYRKEGHRYVPIAWVPTDMLTPGIHLVEISPHGRKRSSLDWLCRKVGEVKKPIDIVSLATLCTMSDGLASHIAKLSEENRSLSAADIAEASLAWISQHLES
jgi:hypothetical protein